MKCSNTLSQIRWIALSLFLSLNVTACMKPTSRAQDPNADFSNPTKGDAKQSASTFYNDEVSGTSVVSKNTGGFSVASEKLFTFKTCVRDKRTQESIKGHKFNILGASKATEMAFNGRSDESGCVNWSEKIAYNGTADAKYIQLKRTIVANGMHTGARDLTICINPWDNSEAVRDCSRRPVPEAQLVKPSEAVNALNGESKIGEKINRYIWVNDLRVNAAHNPGAVDAGMIDFSVAMTPKILRHNIRGEEEPMTLLDGVFSVQFWVVAKTGDGDKCYVLSKSNLSQDVKMRAGSFQEELKMKLNFKSEYGQLEMVGVVSSKDENLDLKPFNGVWILGDHTALLGMKFAFPRPQTYRGEPGSFDAKKYLSNCMEISGDVSPDDVEKHLAEVSGDQKGATTASALMIPPSSRFSRDGDVVDNSIERILADLEKYNGKSGVLAEKKADGQTKITLDKFVKDGAVVPLTGTVPSDLMEDSCPEAKDIPRLFPKDVVAQGLKPGRDFLSCINKGLPSGINRLERFEFGIVDVRPEPVYMETSTERTIRYRVITRVSNPLTQGQPVRDIEFLVEKSDGSSVKYRTNAQGDLIFTDTIHHTYFAPERYMLKVVRISHSSGFSKRLAIIFNPWDNNGFTFARDLRGVNKQTIAQVNLVERPKSELLLTQFQWGTQKFRYEVDNFLNLKIFKTFNLTLNPRVLRYSSLTEGRNRDEPLRAGIYLMKVAIQKDYRFLDGKPMEYVIAVRKLVRVRNGVINEPVEMEFRDFRLLKLRTNLMIELATIDESKLTDAERKTLKVDKPLDTLVDKNSGLAARTFIGPVVAYSNGFSASMRPADDLAEAVCTTIDCDEIKRDYETQIVPNLRAHMKAEGLPGAEEQVEKFVNLSKERRDLGFLSKQELEEIGDPRKYVGSIEHLYKKTVSDMAIRAVELEKLERQRLAANARLSRLLSEENLEYVPVVNEDKILAQDPALPKNNYVLKPGHAFADLSTNLAAFNPEKSLSSTSMMPLAPMVRSWVTKEPFAANALSEAILSKTGLSNAMAARLCVFFVEKVILQRTEAEEKSLGFLDSMSARSSRSRLNDECVAEIARRGGAMPKDGEEGIFHLQRRLRVFQLGRTELRGGNLMGMNVGAGSSYGVSKSQSFSYGWSPTGMAGGLLKLSGAKLVENILDATGLSMSFSRSQGKSMGSDTSSGSGANLAVELRGMRMMLGQYERCTSVRLSQSFLERYFEWFRKAMPNNISLVEKAKRMQRGLLLCDGALAKDPIVADERYYQFSQVLGDEVMNDPTSAENHPFLAATIRGRSDYARLVNAIEATPRSLSDLPDHYNMGELPLERLRRAFKTPTPSFPGLITIEPDTILTAPVVHKMQDGKAVAR